MENAEGTVMIRMKGLNKGEPVTFKYPFMRDPKGGAGSITFSANGVAEVPLAIAKRLLGPDFEGIYEQIAKSEQVVKIEKAEENQSTVPKIKGITRQQSKSAVMVEGSGDVKEFLTKMEEPVVGDGGSIKP